MSNLGVASILTEYVRVHDAWSEFLNKVSDRMMEDCRGWFDSAVAGSTSELPLNLIRLVIKWQNTVWGVDNAQSPRWQTGDIVGPWHLDLVNRPVPCDQSQGGGETFWDTDDAMNFMLWLMVRLQDRKLVRNQHRNAKRAMKKDQQWNVVIDRFNHTPECHEKQADFRARLRKMEMLPLDGTSSVLYPDDWNNSSVAYYECDCCIDFSRTWLKQPFFKETASSHHRHVGWHGMWMSEGCLWGICCKAWFVAWCTAGVQEDPTFSKGLPRVPERFCALLRVNAQQHLSHRSGTDRSGTRWREGQREWSWGGVSFPCSTPGLQTYKQNDASLDCKPRLERENSLTSSVHSWRCLKNDQSWRVVWWMRRLILTNTMGNLSDKFWVSWIWKTDDWTQLWPQLGRKRKPMEIALRCRLLAWDQSPEFLKRNRSWWSRLTWDFKSSRHSVLCQRSVLEEWRTPYARDKQRAKCISSADTSGALSWQVQTNSLQIAYEVPYGFLDLVRRSWV